VHGAHEALAVWQPILAEYARGVLDAQDLWNAIDEFSAGVLPEPRWLPVHPPDVGDAEEATLVSGQARQLDALIGRFVAGSLPAEDLAAEALDVLGLGDSAGDSEP
jgi:hypothetical protein